jgi:2-dehydro-3-deoxyphosphooctonate aldolase (KDO 8-P synthase)
MRRTTIDEHVTVGEGCPLLLLAGPCVIEGEDFTLRMAERLRDVCSSAGVGFVFKSSFDKANRTSIDAFRGHDLHEGLRILQRVKEEIGVPVVTDIHEREHAATAAEVVDVLQIPAFLCRQTDLLLAAAATGRVVNVKKGQFLSPPEMGQVVRKLEAGGAERILVTERGTTFGYNNLVVDFRSLPQLSGFGRPVVFDATHSVQSPGGLGDASGGNREYVPFLARAAVAVGVDALFMEVHEDPDSAPSDGPNMLRLADLPALLRELVAVRGALAESVYAPTASGAGDGTSSA